MLIMVVEMRWCVPVPGVWLTVCQTDRSQRYLGIRGVTESGDTGEKGARECQWYMSVRGPLVPLILEYQRCRGASHTWVPVIHDCQESLSDSNTSVPQILECQQYLNAWGLSLLIMIGLSLPPPVCNRYLLPVLVLLYLTPYVICLFLLVSIWLGC